MCVCLRVCLFVPLNKISFFSILRIFMLSFRATKYECFIKKTLKYLLKLLGYCCLRIRKQKNIDKM